MKIEYPIRYLSLEKAALAIFTEYCDGYTVQGMQTRKSFFLIILLLFALAMSPLTGSSPTEGEVLTRLFEQGPTSVSYTKQFSAAVPLATMEQIVAQLTSQFGAFLEVEGTDNPYSVILEQGKATTYITLDSEGKIAGMQFTEMIPTGITLADAVKVLVELDADTSVLIRKNGHILFAHQEHEPLAVGSSFKLAVLSAVDDAVKEGVLSWDDSVPLDPAWKSLPTGILQSWPDHTPVTISTLATLMISLSDNTATDALIALAGRSRVERYMPDSLPVLTTGEAFRLKDPKHIDLLKRFRNTSVTGKRTVLRQVMERELPDASIFTGDPLNVDIEWHMSTSQLADLLERLESMDLMTVNPGLATAEHWNRIAYKGGSEPGVLNLSTFLIDDKNNRFTVSVTVNDSTKALDESKIMSAYQTILNSL